MTLDRICFANMITLPPLAFQCVHLCMHFADRAVGRLVDVLRAAKQSPMQFFGSMDSDRSGNVAPAELRRALNDAISAVNDESYQHASADELSPPADFQFFSQTVREPSMYLASNHLLHSLTSVSLL